MLRADNIKIILFAILCICFIFYLFLGIYSFNKDKKAKINIVFFALCISVSIMAIGSAFMLISPNVEIANRWRIISALGGCFISPICMSFFFSFIVTNQKNSYSKIQYSLYIASIIFFISNLIYQPSNAVSREAYGFVSISYSTTTIGIIFSIYITVISIVGTLITWFQMRNSPKNRVKKQMKIILIANLITFCLAVTTNLVFPDRKSVV